MSGKDPGKVDCIWEISKEKFGDENQQDLILAFASFFAENGVALRFSPRRVRPGFFIWIDKKVFVAERRRMQAYISGWFRHSDPKVL